MLRGEIKSRPTGLTGESAADPCAAPAVSYLSLRCIARKISYRNPCRLALCLFWILANDWESMETLLV